jgi:hypothetical protein
MSNVFWSSQEQMLKSGHVWHFKIYDKRPEFAHVRNSIVPKLHLCNVFQIQNYVCMILCCSWKFPTRPMIFCSGRERQELHVEGFGRQRTLRSRGIGGKSSAVQTFRYTNGAEPSYLIAT